MDREIGERVRLARSLKHMSQEKLGEQLGVTFQQVQKYEKGVNRISASTLFGIAKILETDLLYFFGGDAKVENGASPPQEFFGATRQDFRILSSLLKLKDGRGKNAIAEVVEAMHAAAAGE